MHQTIGTGAATGTEAAGDLIRELVRAVRAFRLYAGEHPALERMLQRLAESWEAATASGLLTLQFTHDEVRLGECVLHRSTSRQDPMPSLLYDHGIGGLELSAGIDADELHRLAAILATEPGPHDDFAALLWEGNLLCVRVLAEDDGLGPRIPYAALDDEVTALADEEDPDVPARRLSHEEAAIDGELSAGERALLATMVQSDGLVGTVRHAARIICALATEDLDIHQAETLESAITAVVQFAARTGDLEGATEMLVRAHRMRESTRDLELQVGELALACFLDEETLTQLLAQLDRRETLDARDLGDLMTLLGPSTAGVFARWLLETRHAAIVGAALRLFGDVATAALAPLYANATPEEKARITPALLDIGTTNALLTMAQEFATLPEGEQLRLLRTLSRSEEPALRSVVRSALRDGSERVRRTAADAARKMDADAIAALVREQFRTGAFDARREDEVSYYFEMLARIGNREVARALAEQCVVRGLRRAFGRLTDLQVLCLRSLRRMRDSAARGVVADLRARAPRLVRDVLDDPLADL
jgi:hypothetical protein